MFKVNVPSKTSILQQTYSCNLYRKGESTISLDLRTTANQIYKILIRQKNKDES